MTPASSAVDRCCWTCQDQRIGGHLTFLGICEYFGRIGLEPKPIPPAVVDVGCKHWRGPRQTSPEDRPAAASDTN